MIGALSQQHGQFRYGKYLGIVPSNNVNSAPFFTYEIMGEKERRYNQVVQNCITVENSIIIRTNYMYQWLNQAIVELQDGKLYMINNIKEYEEEINPQVYSTVKQGTDVLYYLELIGTEELYGEN